MEQLSRDEFSRLSATERNTYLKKLLGENDSDSSAPSDSDDEDWIPANTARRHQIGITKIIQSMMNLKILKIQAKLLKGIQK
ncbi:unnamed protein product [Arctia plantaginis]|uniref:Uncharacterized protein n=1 Tax=Arctia plantaginis TaxID=874455 RepID=A0A8S1ACY8_ARCPL|nr:unnamed protein product [Arctia plantaginis]